MDFTFIKDCFAKSAPMMPFLRTVLVSSLKFEVRSSGVFPFIIAGGIALPTAWAKAIAWRKRLREGDVGRDIGCSLLDIQKNIKYPTSNIPGCRQAGNDDRSGTQGEALAPTLKRRSKFEIRCSTFDKLSCPKIG